MAGRRCCSCVNVCMSVCFSGTCWNCVDVDFSTRKGIKFAWYAPGNVTENFTVGIFYFVSISRVSFFSLFVQCSGRLLFRNPFSVGLFHNFYGFFSPFFPFFFHNSLEKKKSRNLLIYLLFAFDSFVFFTTFRLGNFKVFIIELLFGTKKERFRLVNFRFRYR